MARTYDFFAHKRDKTLRLVLPSDGQFPEGVDAEDWRHTLTRESGDTIRDVRELISETGYCLFRIGLSIDEIPEE